MSQSRSGLDREGPGENDEAGGRETSLVPLTKENKSGRGETLFPPLPFL